MFIPRLYLDAEYQSHQIISLSGDQHHYLSHVLRAKCGDEFILWNNLGIEHLCKITDIQKKQVSAEVHAITTVNRESPCHIDVKIPLMTHEKMDLVIQKAVELGAQSLTPVVYQRSKAKINQDRLDKKQQHWLKLIESAANQSERSRMPMLHPLQTFEASLQPHIPTLFFAPSSKKSNPLPSIAPERCQLYIGPESGYSEAELSLAKQSQVHFVQLGPRILRAETAVIAAMTYAQTIWGDFH